MDQVYVSKHTERGTAFMYQVSVSKHRERAQMRKDALNPGVRGPRGKRERQRLGTGGAIIIYYLPALLEVDQGEKATFKWEWLLK